MVLGKGAPHYLLSCSFLIRKQEPHEIQSTWQSWTVPHLGTGLHRQRNVTQAEATVGHDDSAPLLTPWQCVTRLSKELMNLNYHQESELFFQVSLLQRLQPNSDSSPSSVANRPSESYTHKFLQNELAHASNFVSLEWSC